MGTQSATRWPTELLAMQFGEATSRHAFQADNAGDNRVRAKDVAIKSRYFEHFGSSLCSVVFELKR